MLASEFFGLVGFSSKLMILSFFVSTVPYLPASFEGSWKS